jgi:hypothetical protein
MRGLTSNSGTSGDSQILYADTTAAESTGGNRIQLKSYGFDASANLFSAPYIYIAIRRGPMAVPESATDVFDVNAITGNGTSDRAINTGFVTDVHLSMRRSSNYPTIVDRLRGHGSGSTKRLATHVTNAEQSLTGNYWLGLDTNDGYILSSDYENQSSQTYVQNAWKRAPNFFDAVAYTGNDTAGRTVAHNLGVVPEMIWVKNRSAAVEWAVYHKDVSLGFLKLNTSDAKIGGYVFGASSSNDDQSATNIILSSGNAVNELNKNYIAYLFASLDGVSKVGSFTYAGTTLNVDCGFSAGARFVLYKRYNTTGSWLVLDSERGINASANDPVLYLNATDAEDSGYNLIEPYSAGFTITGNDVGNGDYIFYAIA